MSNQKSQAFQENYGLKVREIITFVNLFSVSSPDKGIRIKAVWDTGATNTVVAPDIANQLKLSQIDTAKIVGVNSESDEGVVAPVALVHISLPNNILLRYKRVSIAKKIAGGVEMLIGMDIITLGDFLISNANQETSFSFVMPSFPDQPDWLERSRRINDEV